MNLTAHSTNRDSWGSKWGFILACIGSAVGMGNIWLFPARISKYGGATFLIPYLIFVVIIGSTGVIGEMAFGRATRSGPVDAFGTATRLRFGRERRGKKDDRKSSFSCVVFFCICRRKKGRTDPCLRLAWFSA